MSRVYLSGPMTGLLYEEADNWRQIATRTLTLDGIGAINPLRGKDGLRGKVFSTSYDYGEEILNTGNSSILQRDHFDVTNADVVLCFLAGATKVSIGTVAELAWAHTHRIPIVVVAEKEGNVHDHPFIRAMAGWWVEDLNKGLLVVEQLLQPYVASEGDFDVVTASKAVGG